MATEWKELNLSKEVAASTTMANTYIPASGKIVSVICFCGNAVYTVNSVVKAVWDYDTVNEEIIWSSKGDVQTDLNYEATGDGVKKLAIVLENGEDGPVVMSGMIKFVEQ
jgi:hypothetical protein